MEDSVVFFEHEIAMRKSCEKTACEPEISRS
jgi:hypothetical protein